MSSPQLQFRAYQAPVFENHTSGVLVLHWARQIGKSFTLAAWAVDRLLRQLRQHPQWLVTVLSNSRDNGAEFVLKCQQVSNEFGRLLHASSGGPQPVATDQLLDLRWENLRMEVRITCGRGLTARTGRIKVLAATPRTARGFSGDLILDEFAYHEDGAAIWQAAEPILAANPEFLCRVASTGNGKFNLFYRMVTGREFDVSRVSRTDAWRLGVPIFDPATRQPITPDEARARALDLRAYDQNYELAFGDENMALLTQELIAAAEDAALGPIDEQAWSHATLQRIAGAPRPFYVGHDIGRNQDLSVVTVLEREGDTHRVLGMLRMAGMRLPAQQAQVDLICGLPRFSTYAGDMTGLGLGLIEYLQERWGAGRIRGLNFSHVETLTPGDPGAGLASTSARVTEVLATRLLEAFEARTLRIPSDGRLRVDLRKPERITSPGGRVSIAATRDEAGHADHFWSLALALRAATTRTSFVCLAAPWPGGRPAGVRGRRALRG